MGQPPVPPRKCGHTRWEKPCVAPSRLDKPPEKFHPLPVLRGTWPLWNMGNSLFQAFSTLPLRKRKKNKNLCASTTFQETFNKNCLPRKILQLPQFPTLSTGRQGQGNSPGTTRLWLMQMFTVANPNVRGGQAKCSQHTLKTLQKCTRWKGDNVWSFLKHNISSHLRQEERKVR